jgi:hypothetical protein
LLARVNLRDFRRRNIEYAVLGEQVYTVLYFRLGEKCNVILLIGLAVHLAEIVAERGTL